jgi:hypothetical protein
MDRKSSSSMPFVHLLSSKSGEGMDHLQQSVTEILSHAWQASDVKHPVFYAKEYLRAITIRIDIDCVAVAYCEQIN